MKKIVVFLEDVKLIAKKGFFHIFSASFINKIIGFASGIFIVRFLSKTDYGIYSYSRNILSFFLLLNGLGVTQAILQFGSESNDLKKRNSFVLYGFKIGIGFNVLLLLAIYIYSYYGPLTIAESRYILRLMVFMPIVIIIYQITQIYLRASLLNKKYSYLTTINTTLLLLFSIIGALLFNVKGVVFFRYFAYLFSILFGFIIIKNNVSSIRKSTKLKKHEKNSFLKFSIVSASNNGFSRLLYIFDLFLVGYFVKDAEVIASYKTATLIPFALNFIPSSIMTFVYPYFARNNKNRDWIKEKYYILLKYSIPFNLLISLFLIVFAPLIIKLVFGVEYMDSVLPFRILSLGFFVNASFRMPSGNILVMLKRIKFGFYLNITVGILNIILDIILIKFMGSIGAAIATTSIFVISSIAVMVYLVLVLNKE